MGSVADIAAELIHFTGYEVAVSNILMPSPVHRLLGTMPKEIEFIDVLPMTTTRKVQRRVLRSRKAERKRTLTKT